MIDRKYRKARIWSNIVLKKYAAHFSGEIVNVSAWKDSDKCGGRYREYFTRADQYYITNYGGYMGGSGDEGEIILDLEKSLGGGLEQRFDVVFNHTTLEHVFHVGQAFENLCRMARDAVILVVPFAQEQHVSDSYNDYWRLTPFCIEQLFERNGFTLVVCEHNNEFNAAVYLFCIGIRDEKMTRYKEFQRCKAENCAVPGRWIGSKVGEWLRQSFKKA